jgi:predicted SAM-dependent methyltransferase
MVWRIDDPQGNESGKILWETVQYTRGQGLDLGCGPNKVWPHAIGVDNYTATAQFGTPMKPDVVSDCAKLQVFGSASMDWVYSSHLLEHIQDTAAALKEWWRVLKPGGHLILYLPHKDHYPNIGQPGANPDHKHDFLPQDIVDHMRDVGAWDLVRNEDRADGREAPVQSQAAAAHKARRGVALRSVRRCDPGIQHPAGAERAGLSRHLLLHAQDAGCPAP